MWKTNFDKVDYEEGELLNILYMLLGYFGFIESACPIASN